MEGPREETGAPDWYEEEGGGAQRVGGEGGGSESVERG